MVSLNNNKLKTIPKFKSNVLQSIDLGENNIEEIPEGIFSEQLETLYALRLSGNDITGKEFSYTKFQPLHFLENDNNFTI